MRKLFLVALLLGGCRDKKELTKEVKSASPMPSFCRKGVCAGSTCLSSITPSAATQPSDACPFEGESQTDTDIFSWNSFIAMNWPATTSCAPDPSKSILSGSSPTVWESFAQDSDVFVAPPASPAPFCNGSGKPLDARLGRVPPKVRALAEKTGVYHFLHQSAKAPKSVAAALPAIAQAVGGVLTDQNGRFVRYEVHLNQDEYTYLVNNSLWTYAGQKQASVIDFPVTPTGAMEIKAAWKILTDAEVAGKRFYTTRAIVYNDESGEPSPGTNPVTLGLVGLHITHKTVGQKTWFWATFEQVDNTTSSFFNPSCSATACPPNQQTAPANPVELTPDGKPINKPVQVVRSVPIPASPDLNSYYRGLLAGSVWANYQLVSTNWATGGAPQGTPPVVGNVTLETYIQPTASCFQCHKMAPTADGKNADFSYLLIQAAATAAKK